MLTVDSVTATWGILGTPAVKACSYSHPGAYYKSVHSQCITESLKCVDTNGNCEPVCNDTHEGCVCSCPEGFQLSGINCYGTKTYSQYCQSI